ncbi:hypothetical protein BDY21DRAFT_285807 [Lineolata rhizophorae]|uniref:HTH APSES-type domain-containing protein n=1 Tax=Lineolata rhizophorae TaxID=578093 RepID=A0A6A6P0I5_9PEZI|nr:hypothetical protein BDY21DRAFT_285807 [Lineolata rhizophorae]
MPGNPAHASSSAPPSMSHYSQFQQPTLLQPGPQSYSTSQTSYTQYGYPTPAPSAGQPATTSMSQSMVPPVPQSLPLPAMTTPQSSTLPAPQPYGQGHTFDTTGQIAPPGMKPRVTATLWEDEGSLCFQVEAKGVCVARREDNHMINGTKLLNVAGMTRGRRDGILKSEKTRHVVKIGPMHLKGVWIPFERALDFANKEKITELLYPLFVHDIGALLYHPSNQRGAGVGASAAMAAVDRRRADQPQQRYLTAPPQSSQPPSLHHHHSISNPVSSHVHQPSHSIAPHPASGRPGIDRAHTFPTPPTSASSLIGMGNQGSSYEWGGQSVSNMQGSQPLSIDTGLSNARSVPNTPASTPPGSMGNMPQYQTTQGYDSQRPMYTAPPVQQPAPYSSQQYSRPMQSANYPKNEMAPPTKIGPEEPAAPDSKPPESLLTHVPPEQVGHAAGEEGEHEHESEYTHTSAPYNASRPAYGYNPAPPAPALHGEHPHLSPEMTGSPSHQNGSGRATPRTTSTAQSQWPPSYSTPQRAPQPPSSNLYAVMDNRGPPNGSATAETYAAPSTMQTGYASAPYGAANGASSNKRMREDDDQDQYARPENGEVSPDVDGLKRRKTMHEGPVGGSIGGLTHPQPVMAARRR